MIGSSVVPGLPNRCVTPSSFSNARNAERPVILFFIVPPARRFVGRGMEADDQTWRVVAMERGLWLPCSYIFCVPDAVRHFVPECVRGTRALGHPLTFRALLLFRTVPDYARIAFQRHQRFAGVGPFLQFLDCDVVERLPPGSA